ncbi:heme ABC exporter ATP-binding protein CcmA [Alphaproteobacteria bacterium]|nr:heme ABC exporter ATP-binding protein CcmA [Alphaproteobacteria bacterium]
MINLENLTIQRGSRTIFSDFNSVIETGLVTIIKGENGSGKSTLLRALAGFIPLENGKIELNKKSIFSSREEWSQKLIFIDTKNGLSRDLTIIENLKSWVAIKGWATNEENLKNALKSVNIDKHANLFISQCSEGLKKRAALARLYYSFINNIDFWILDEPTNELDQQSCVLFQQLIFKFLKQKGTVIIASHNLNILEKKYNIIDLTLLNKQRIL